VTSLLGEPFQILLPGLRQAHQRANILLHLIQRQPERRGEAGKNLSGGRSLRDGVQVQDIPAIASAEVLQQTTPHSLLAVAHRDEIQVVGQLGSPYQPQETIFPVEGRDSLELPLPIAQGEDVELFASPEGLPPYRLKSMGEKRDIGRASEEYLIPLFRQFPETLRPADL
jgi:hypothetical protein